MNSNPSPLFIPAIWEGTHFKVLDETLLPQKLEFITVNEVPQALQAVKEMKTRAFGQVLTFFYAVALVAQGYESKDPDPLRQRLFRLADEFNQARPTFDFKELAGFFSEWFQQLPPGEEVGNWIGCKVHESIAGIIKRREERAKRCAALLPNPCRLLTHCNISGELVSVARCCEEMGKALYVTATETRPYLQGSRLTAWEVCRAGIPVSLIPDCAIAQLLAKGEIDTVLVGADRCAQNGDVINKVGTYPIALMAKKYGVPFYALVQDPGPLARGADVLIEERPVSELLTFQGQHLAPEGSTGIHGYYPAFDVTPAALISSLIGFDGVFTPERFRQNHDGSTASSKDEKKRHEKHLLVYGIPKPSDYSYLSHALKAEQCQAVLVPEMRPELWGGHLVSRDLSRKNIPTTLISDNMMGTFFAQEKIHRLYVFYTGLDKDGPVGICGSLLATQLARAHGVPIELLAGEEAKETSRDQDVSTFLGQRVSPDGVTIYPIEPEVLPWFLFQEDKRDL
ncbi:MAG: hypothetical protein ACE5HC_12415 [Candidatus Binatia bacterium]